MKVLLIDTDSTIPNLALMKISAYEKSQGNQVGFNIADPDKVYCSIIFDWNRHKADGLKFLYPNAIIDIGGSGYDLKKKLPPEIDSIAPDYSLYPNCDHDLGFTTRGCIRNCPFCIVKRKEGEFTIYEHPSKFHHPDHKNIVLMDNNILASKSWFFTVTDWIISNNLKVDFNQGLDIRLVDEEVAERLKQLKPMNNWRFAFDSLSYEKEVIRGIELLKNAGVNIRSKSLFYVYLDSDKEFNDALKRCQILRSLGVMPYPMYNRHAERTPRMTALKRWCRPWIFFKIEWENYDKSVKKIHDKREGGELSHTIVKKGGELPGGVSLD